MKLTEWMDRLTEIQKEHPNEDPIISIEGLNNCTETPKSQLSTFEIEYSKCDEYNFHETCKKCPNHNRIKINHRYK